MKPSLLYQHTQHNMLPVTFSTKYLTDTASMHSLIIFLEVIRNSHKKQKETSITISITFCRLLECLQDLIPIAVHAVPLQEREVIQRELLRLLQWSQCPPIGHNGSGTCRNIQHLSAVQLLNFQQLNTVLPQSFRQFRQIHALK